MEEIKILLHDFSSRPLPRRLQNIPFNKWKNQLHYAKSFKRLCWKTLLWKSSYRYRKFGSSIKSFWSFNGLSNNVGHNRELMKKVKELGSSMARIAGDINDNWESISSAAIEALNFIDISGNGFYPDPDMLQVGYIGIPNGLNTQFHKTHLTMSEQYFGQFIQHH